MTKHSIFLDGMPQASKSKITTYSKNKNAKDQANESSPEQGKLETPETSE